MRALLRLAGTEDDGGTFLPRGERRAEGSLAGEAIARGAAVAKFSQFS